MGRNSKKGPLGVLQQHDLANEENAAKVLASGKTTTTVVNGDTGADVDADVKHVETEEFVITIGHSLCGTLKGMMKPGDPVDPSCLRDGEVGFKNHIESGTIVTKDEYLNQLKAKAKK